MNEPHAGAHLPASQALSDEDIVRRVLSGETPLFEVLMRRHNQRVYRAIRSILRSEADVEDTMQQAYLQAWAHLAEFSAASAFSTWLTRIAINEALMRVRKSARLKLVPEFTDREPQEEPSMAAAHDPERSAETRELARLLEAAVESLPEMYRTTFMLREIEGLSTAEVAEILGVTEDVVKTRLHRARGLTRDALFQKVGRGAAEAFAFHAPRCDRVVAAVMAKIAS